MPTELASMRLRELTELHETSADGLVERLLIEVEDTHWDDEDKRLVHLALEDATRIHHGDTQGERPVLVHPLRVALRILSRDHFNVRDRPDLIISALIHDTVEDHPERWLKEFEDDDLELAEYGQSAIYDLQQRALDSIARRYQRPDDDANLSGQNIRGIVQWLTSEPYRDDLNDGIDDPVEKQLRKWDVYEDVVRGLMQAPDALGSKVIKLSDFIENFIGGMTYHENHAMRPRMARKYVFLSNDMSAFVKRSKIIPRQSQATIKRQIEAARNRALTIINRHVALHPDDARLFDISKKTTDRLAGREKVRRKRSLGFIGLSLHVFDK